MRWLTVKSGKEDSLPAIHVVVALANAVRLFKPVRLGGNEWQVRLYQVATVKEGNMYETWDYRLQGKRGWKKNHAKLEKLDVRKDLCWIVSDLSSHICRPISVRGDPQDKVSVHSLNKHKRDQFACEHHVYREISTGPESSDACV